MEQEKEQAVSQENEQYAEPPAYVPRPRWQVWGARIALVVFIVMIILYYINISRGGI